MGARITPELDEKILEMYQHRINLILEAEEYTIEKIAERLGIGTTSVWARTHGLDMVKREDTYVQRLEDELARVKRALETTKLEFSQILAAIRKATEAANKKHEAASRIFSNVSVEISPLVVKIQKVLNR